MSARTRSSPELALTQLSVVGGSTVEIRRAGSEFVVLRVSNGARGALEAWLADRPETKEIAHREDELHVRFADAPRTPGAFVRSLRDRVFTATQLPVPTLRVRIVHLLEGRVRLQVDGIDDDEVLRLAEHLRGLPGVARATASPASRSLLVTFDPAVTTARAISDEVARGDRKAWPPAVRPKNDHSLARTVFNSAVFAAAASGVVPAVPMGAAVALTALPSVRRMLGALGEKRLSVDLLDVAAIGISIGTGAPTTGAFITWLLGIGDIILARTSDSARNAIAKLVKLDATEAWVVRGEKLEKTAAKSLRVGDVLVVGSGTAVAADGVVVAGHAQVDEKALTGESVPREKRVGDRVLAATTVVDGELRIEIERTGRDTTAAKIVQILENAGAKPMTLQRDVERIADRLVLPTFGVAGGAAALGAGIGAATSVLITDFGTGIRVSVPTATLAAITVAAREGLLIKGAQYLERLSKVDTIVFDKTGTLTTGTPRVFDVAPLHGSTVEEVIRFAGAAEERQKHPVAEAIRAFAAREGLSLPDAEPFGSVYTIGMGVRARVEGHEVVVGGVRFMRSLGVHLSKVARILEAHEAMGGSSVLTMVDEKLVGVIGIADESRPESRAVVEALRAGGRRQVVLMSGDGRMPVESVARAVGADRAYWELLPENKAAQVRALQAEGRVVAMVGDGINDAPALALADVGISLEGGTDVAIETADVVLLEGGLAKLPHAFEVADDAMKRIRRALGLVIAPNAIAIGLGAIGLLPPSLAALVNNGSTVAAALAGAAPLFSRRKT
ncbi:MAG: heavy metal translocating P-type ATPase [Polyangiales bacterium]